MSIVPDCMAYHLFVDTTTVEVSTKRVYRGRFILSTASGAAGSGCQDNLYLQQQNYYFVLCRSDDGIFPVVTCLFG